ncbi:MAG: hypothetical protein HS107_07400 [Thermoflexaceae bacterium]|nr:hypothetical protein [Thermoflexaceae bacterium]
MKGLGPPGSLIGAVLAEQNDEWLVTRRHLSEESMKPLFVRPVPPPPEEVAIEQSLPLAVWTAPWVSASGRHPPRWHRRYTT